MGNLPEKSMDLSTRVILTLLRSIHFRDRIAREFQDPSRTGKAYQTRRYPRRLHPYYRELNGCQLLTLRPKGAERKHLIYLPGGAYVLEATPYHSRLVCKLAEQLGCAVTLLGYPLAPENHFQITFHRTLAAYQEIIRDEPACEIHLMGDSAGGGLALALLQGLLSQNIQPRPKKTVLISPWLDLGLQNPDIAKVAPDDPILSLEGLRFAAQTYAAGEALSDPRLSPLYGDLSGLGCVLITYATREVFYPDCQLLVKKLAISEGSEVVNLIGKDLFHAWPIFPLPASRNALLKITDFLITKR